jgi:hypothetical protein
MDVKGSTCYFRVLTRQLAGKTKKTHENPAEYEMK